MAYQSISNQDSNSSLKEKGFCCRAYIYRKACCNEIPGEGSGPPKIFIKSLAGPPEFPNAGSIKEILSCGEPDSSEYCFDCKDLLPSKKFTDGSGPDGDGLSYDITQEGALQMVFGIGQIKGNPPQLNPLRMDSVEQNNRGVTVLSNVAVSEVGHRGPNRTGSSLMLPTDKLETNGLQDLKWGFIVEGSMSCLQNSDCSIGASRPNSYFMVKVDKYTYSDDASNPGEGHTGVLVSNATANINNNTWYAVQIQYSEGVMSISTKAMSAGDTIRGLCTGKTHKFCDDDSLQGPCFDAFPEVGEDLQSGWHTAKIPMPSESFSMDWADETMAPYDNSHTNSECGKGWYPYAITEEGTVKHIPNAWVWSEANGPGTDSYDSGPACIEDSGVDNTIRDPGSDVVEHDVDDYVNGEHQSNASGKKGTVGKGYVINKLKEQVGCQPINTRGTHIIEQISVGFPECGFTWGSCDVEDVPENEIPPCQTYVCVSDSMLWGFNDVYKKESKAKTLTLAKEGDDGWEDIKQRIRDLGIRNPDSLKIKIWDYEMTGPWENRTQGPQKASWKTKYRKKLVLCGATGGTEERKFPLSWNLVDQEAGAQKATVFGTLANSDGGEIAAITKEEMIEMALTYLDKGRSKEEVEEIVDRLCPISGEDASGGYKILKMNGKFYGSSDEQFEWVPWGYANKVMDSNLTKAHPDHAENRIAKYQEALTEAGSVFKNQVGNDVYRLKVSAGKCVSGAITNKQVPICKDKDARMDYWNFLNESGRKIDKIPLAITNSCKSEEESIAPVDNAETDCPSSICVYGIYLHGQAAGGTSHSAQPLFNGIYAFAGLDSEGKPQYTRNGANPETNTKGSWIIRNMIKRRGGKTFHVWILECTNSNDDGTPVGILFAGPMREENTAIKCPLTDTFFEWKPVHGTFRGMKTTDKAGFCTENNDSGEDTGGLDPSQTVDPSLFTFAIILSPSIPPNVVPVTDMCCSKLTAAEQQSSNFGCTPWATGPDGHIESIGSWSLELGIGAFGFQKNPQNGNVALAGPAEWYEEEALMEYYQPDRQPVGGKLSNMAFHPVGLRAQTKSKGILFSLVVKKLKSFGYISSVGGTAQLGRENLKTLAQNQNIGGASPELLFGVSGMPETEEASEFQKKFGQEKTQHISTGVAINQQYLEHYKLDGGATKNKHLWGASGTESRSFPDLYHQGRDNDTGVIRGGNGSFDSFLNSKGIGIYNAPAPTYITSQVGPEWPDKPNRVQYPDGEFLYNGSKFCNGGMYNKSPYPNLFFSINHDDAIRNVSYTDPYLHVDSGCWYHINFWIVPQEGKAYLNAKSFPKVDPRIEWIGNPDDGKKNPNWEKYQVGNDDDNGTTKTIATFDKVTRREINEKIGEWWPMELVEDRYGKKTTERDAQGNVKPADEQGPAAQYKYYFRDGMYMDSEGLEYYHRSGKVSRPDGTFQRGVQKGHCAPYNVGTHQAVFLGGSPGQKLGDRTSTFAGMADQDNTDDVLRCFCIPEIWLIKSVQVSRHIPTQPERLEGVFAAQQCGSLGVLNTFAGRKPEQWKDKTPCKKFKNYIPRECIDFAPMKPSFQCPGDGVGIDGERQIPPEALPEGRRCLREAWWWCEGDPDDVKADPDDDCPFVFCGDDDGGQDGPSQENSNCANCHLNFPFVAPHTFFNICTGEIVQQGQACTACDFFKCCEPFVEDDPDELVDVGPIRDFDGDIRTPFCWENPEDDCPEGEGPELSDIEWDSATYREIQQKDIGMSVTPPSVNTGPMPCCCFDFCNGTIRHPDGYMRATNLRGLHGQDTKAMALWSTWSYLTQPGERWANKGIVRETKSTTRSGGVTKRYTPWALWSWNSIEPEGGELSGEFGAARGGEETGIIFGRAMGEVHKNIKIRRWSTDADGKVPAYLEWVQRYQNPIELKRGVLAPKYGHEKEIDVGKNPHPADEWLGGPRSDNWKTWTGFERVELLDEDDEPTGEFELKPKEWPDSKRPNTDEWNNPNKWKSIYIQKEPPGSDAVFVYRPQGTRPTRLPANTGRYNYTNLRNSENYHEPSVWWRYAPNEANSYLYHGQFYPEHTSDYISTYTRCGTFKGRFGGPDREFESVRCCHEFMPREMTIAGIPGTDDEFGGVKKPRAGQKTVRILAAAGAEIIKGMRLNEWLEKDMSYKQELIAHLLGYTDWQHMSNWYTINNYGHIYLHRGFKDAEANSGILSGTLENDKITRVKKRRSGIVGPFDIKAKEWAGSLWSLAGTTPHSTGWQDGMGNITGCRPLPTVKDGIEFMYDRRKSVVMKEIDVTDEEGEVTGQKWVEVNETSIGKNLNQKWFKGGVKYWLAPNPNKGNKNIKNKRFGEQLSSTMTHDIYEASIPGATILSVADANAAPYPIAPEGKWKWEGYPEVDGLNYVSGRSMFAATTTTTSKNFFNVNSKVEVDIQHYVENFEDVESMDISSNPDIYFTYDDDPIISEADENAGEFLFSVPVDDFYSDAGQHMMGTSYNYEQSLLMWSGGTLGARSVIKNTSYGMMQPKSISYTTPHLSWLLPGGKGADEWVPTLKSWFSRYFGSPAGLNTALNALPPPHPAASKQSYYDPNEGDLEEEGLAELGGYFDAEMKPMLWYVYETWRKSVNNNRHTLFDKYTFYKGGVTNGTEDRTDSNEETAAGGTSGAYGGGALWGGPDDAFALKGNPWSPDYAGKWYSEGAIERYEKRGILAALEGQSLEDYKAPTLPNFANDETESAGPRWPPSASNAIYYYLKNGSWPSRGSLKDNAGGDAGGQDAGYGYPSGAATIKTIPYAMKYYDTSNMYWMSGWSLKNSPADLLEDSGKIKTVYNQLPVNTEGDIIADINSASSSFPCCALNYFANSASGIIERDATFEGPSGGLSARTGRPINPESGNWKSLLGEAKDYDDCINTDNKTTTTDGDGNTVTSYPCTGGPGDSSKLRKSLAKKIAKERSYSEYISFDDFLKMRYVEHCGVTQSVWYYGYGATHEVQTALGTPSWRIRGWRGGGQMSDIRNSAISFQDSDEKYELTPVEVLKSYNFSLFDRYQWFTSMGVSRQVQSFGARYKRRVFWDDEKSANEQCTDGMGTGPKCLTCGNSYEDCCAESNCYAPVMVSPQSYSSNLYQDNQDPDNQAPGTDGEWKSWCCVPCGGYERAAAKYPIPCSEADLGHCDDPGWPTGAIYGSWWEHEGGESTAPLVPLEKDGTPLGLDRVAHGIFVGSSTRGRWFSQPDAGYYGENAGLRQNGNWSYKMTSDGAYNAETGKPIFGKYGFIQFYKESEDCHGSCPECCPGGAYYGNGKYCTSSLSNGDFTGIQAGKIYLWISHMGLNSNEFAEAKGRILSDEVKQQIWDETSQTTGVVSTSMDIMSGSGGYPNGDGYGGDSKSIYFESHGQYGGAQAFIAVANGFTCSESAQSNTSPYGSRLNAYPGGVQAWIDAGYPDTLPS